jgi:tetratricopeptide (TPR) repeat protein
MKVRARHRLSYIVLVIVLGDLTKLFAADDRSYESISVSPVAQARVAVSIGETERALEILTDVLNDSPRDVSALYERALVQFSRSHFDAVVSDTTTLLNEDPRSAKAHVLRGRAFLRKHDFSAAMAAFDSALEIDADDVDALFWKSELPGQELDMARITRLAPGHAAVAFNRIGTVGAEPVSATEAIEIATQAIVLEPDFAIPYLVRGQGWLELGNQRAAELDYESYLKLTTVERPATVAALGLLYATSHDSRARDGARALVLAKQAVMARGGRRFEDIVAAAYAETGDFIRAKEWQAKYIHRLERECEAVKRAGGPVSRVPYCMRALPIARRHQELYQLQKPRREDQLAETLLPGNRQGDDPFAP